MTLMYVMHHGFRRDLAAFAAATQATPTSDRATWQALARRWATFSRVLHHHHSGEDAGVWPTLMARTDDAGRAVLEAMEAEHEQIDPALEACGAGFARLAAHADEDARAALAVRLVATREALGRHLEHEETEAIAIIQTVLTDAEWQALDKEYFQKNASLSLVKTLVPWALHGLDPAALDRIMGHAAVPHRVMWALTRGGFARREQQAFRYVD
jgi:type IV secretory pathway VirJ component